MKKFMVILQYEIMTYLKNKGYMFSTVLIALLAAAAMFIPNFIDLSGLTGKAEKSEQNEQVQDDKTDQADKELLVLYDKTGAFSDISILDSAFEDYRFEKCNSEKEIKDKVESKEAEGGFIVNSLTSYEYVVYNKSMYDSNNVVFTQIMTTINQIVYCANNNLDYEAIQTAFNPQIDNTVTIIGKDMGSNYWYCYILVIIIFMIIIFYGVMVATSVTQEKSNRTIEVLVTSADTRSLFFGKVLAGTVAALFQSGLIMLCVLGSYKVNQDAWNGFLDMLFDIPLNVVATFGLFGLGGVVFYTFIYGALGALVSKTEDINKVAGNVQLIVMVVYFISLFQLTNVDGVAMKVLSYIPFSSYSAMFARVAMGSVELWEVIVSFVILVASILGMGFIGAKIYRLGTLRYGNPIKILSAVKSVIKHEE
ncbi:MAG: ABC transporter permease [Eubacteriales bacterium]|nr:ABC transporter permease [Eubacteriales bacterium]